MREEGLAWGAERSDVDKLAALNSAGQHVRSCWAFRQQTALQMRAAVALSPLMGRA